LRETFAELKRIVVKVGTSTLTYENGKLNLTRIEHLVRQIADLQNQGKQMLLVSSGAVGTGANRLGWTKKPETLPEKQALAAIGQGALMHIYEKLFSEYNQIVAQILLTRDDLNERGRYLNMSNAFNMVLQLGAIPIINENDTVAVDELKYKFGDNDSLSALVASVVDADLLILLSDIDGLYTADPRHHPEAKLLDQVKEITAEMEAGAQARGGAFSTGGMITKLHAARQCMGVGVPMVIANSAQPEVLRRLIAGEGLGTVFWPKNVKTGARKKWIAIGTVPQGSVTVDSGCAAALHQGKSLLASGIVECRGDFSYGAVISILDPAAEEIARGVCNYSAGDIKLIMGRRSGEIEAILGNKYYDEVIHRDNLYVL
jgi:glutamate 5-kinase